MNTKPVGDRVLVIPVKEETREQAEAEGVVFADATPEEVTQGEIRAVGDGDLVQAKNFLSGTVVIFSKYVGEEVIINEEKCKIIDLADILAVVGE